MPMPRKSQITLEAIPYYHCVSRCAGPTPFLYIIVQTQTAWWDASNRFNRD